MHIICVTLVCVERVLRDLHDVYHKSKCWKSRPIDYVQTIQKKACAGGTDQ